MLGRDPLESVPAKRQQSSQEVSKHLDVSEALWK